MRIAVIGTRGAEGVERTLNEVCPRLRRRGHTVEVMDTAWRALSGFDVVHYGAAAPRLLPSLVARLSPGRLVLGVHGGAGSAPAATWATRLAQRVIVPSRRLERRLRDAHGLEPVFIPYGADPPDQPPPAEALRELGLAPRRYALLADRLVPGSGAHHAVAAMNALPARTPLVVAETGPAEPEYRARLMEDADRTKVTFVGPVAAPVLDALIAHAHLIVLPSLDEEPPPALLRAMALGKAVVASDLAEHLDVIGPDGFTFTAGEVGDLRRVLMWLMEDGDVVARMEIRAAANARTRHSWDRIARAYEQVLASVV
jgi:glycosyltransferase involved in cell wall biosynthesis